LEREDRPPIRVRTESINFILTEAAGTYDPICAIITIKAIIRTQELLLYGRTSETRSYHVIGKDIPSHVWARDYLAPGCPVSHLDGVRDVRVRTEFIHHRVLALFNFQDIFVYELGPYVAFSHGDMGKAEQTISNGQFVDSFSEDIIMSRGNILKERLEGS
jgi:hypothetical protein